MQRASCVAAAMVILSLPGLAQADVLNLGILSFDQFIPGAPGQAGLNLFSISDFTGTDALPSDFPSTSAVVFKDSTLTLVGSSTEVVSLGDIDPGFFSVPAVQTADNVPFASAEFTATIDVSTPFLLADGSLFTPNSATIDVLLTPSSGNTLVEADFAPIDVSNAPAALPEPSSWLLAGSVLLAVWPFRRTIKSIARNNSTYRGR